MEYKVALTRARSNQIDNVSSASIVSSAVAAATISAAANIDADLKAIGELNTNTGWLKKTGPNTWELDNSSFLTNISSVEISAALGYTPYNSSNPNGYQTAAQVNTAIQGIISAKGVNVITGTVPVMSGTSLIPAGNTSPVVTEGTQIMSTVVTPTSASSTFEYNFQTFVGTGTTGRIITLALYRDSTLIAVAPTYCSSTSKPFALSIHGYDTPQVTTDITYSLRVGISNSATWNIGKSSNSISFGSNTSTWTIIEYL